MHSMKIKIAIYLQVRPRFAPASEAVRQPTQADNMGGSAPGRRCCECGHRGGREDHQYR